MIFRYKPVTINSHSFSDKDVEDLMPVKIDLEIWKKYPTLAAEKDEPGFEK